MGGIGPGLATGLVMTADLPSSTEIETLLVGFVLGIVLCCLAGVVMGAYMGVTQRARVLANLPVAVVLMVGLYFAIPQATHLWLDKTGPGVGVLEGCAELFDEHYALAWVGPPLIAAATLGCTSFAYELFFSGSRR